MHCKSMASFTALLGVAIPTEIHTFFLNHLYVFRQKCLRVRDFHDVAIGAIFLLVAFIAFFCAGFGR